MRPIGAIYTITLILLSFIGFPLSFSQQMSSNFFINTSTDIIDAGETVLIRISVTLQPNSTGEMVVRFVPPQGSAQQYPLHLRPDPIGFASEVVDYPKDVSNASTSQPGNYTVLIQDMQTRMVVDTTSFEVSESQDLVDYIINSIQNSQSIFSAVIVVVVGAALTYWYNFLSSKRETKVSLDQKKSEYFMELRAYYNRLAGSAGSIAQNLERIRKMDNKSSEQFQERCRVCFYYVSRFLAEDRAIFEKTGAFTLHSLGGEFVGATLRGKILNRLRSIFTMQEFEELRYILSESRSLRDMEGELRRNYGALHIYEKFENWIRESDPKAKQDLAFELHLFYKVLSYEINSIFIAWYPRRKRNFKNFYLRNEKDPIMDKTKDEITSDLKKVNWDPEDRAKIKSLNYP